MMYSGVYPLLKNIANFVDALSAKLFWPNKVCFQEFTSENEAVNHALNCNLTHCMRQADSCIFEN